MKDGQGNVVVSKLDEETLKKIAYSRFNYAGNRRQRCNYEKSRGEKNS